MKQHYHVMCGSGGGYLPDTCEYHTTKKGAQVSAKWHADSIRDAEYCRVRGNARDGYVVTCVPVSQWDLGYLIQVVPCSDTCCFTDAE
jgi:hypothetical protein